MAGKPHSLQTFVLGDHRSPAEKFAALGPIAQRHGQFPKGTKLPFTLTPACPRVKVADFPPGHIPQRYLEALESKLGTGEMLKLFATLGSKMGEPSFAADCRSGNAGGFGTTPAQAQAQISDLKLDKGFMERYMGGDKDAMAKMQRLMEAAHGA